KLKYFVHWKGYPKEEDSWEPVENLRDNNGVSDEFHHTHPSAPRPRPRNVRFNYKTIENFTTTPHLPGHLYNWENGKMQSVRPISVDTILKRGVMS
ncbi:hypothetical protein B0H17DRAFT_944977, partial [Mycena rosella]